MNQNEPQITIRLDRWLWAARFYKTRSLAKSAIELGRIEIAGQRTKASKEVTQGDELNIRKGETTQTVIVSRVSEKRGPAKTAQTLYQETEQSKLEREIRIEKKKIERASYQSPSQKPSKRDRRQLQDLKLLKPDFQNMTD